MNTLFKRKKIKVYLWVLTISTATLLTIGYVFGIEKNFVLPVDKMNTKSYNQKSFWFGPWGQSIVHMVTYLGRLEQIYFLQLQGLLS